MEWSHFSIKILGTNFGNASMDNSNWDKISENIAKTELNSLWEGKINHKPNPLIKTLIHIPVVYNSKIR